MSLPVGLMNIFVLKSRVEARFVGGLEGFREQLQHYAEDDFLFRMGAMSGQDFAEIVDALVEGGLDPDKDLATAEGMHGPGQQCPGIIFTDMSPESLIGGWVARAEAEPVSPDILGNA